jgi:hypothetical protein
MCLAISCALLPYLSSLIVIFIQQVSWVALTGVVTCAVCTSLAYFLRKQRDLTTAKLRFIADPFLYASEFVLTALLVRYVFMR